MTVHILFDMDPSERFNSRRSSLRYILPLLYSLADDLDTTSLHLVLPPFHEDSIGPHAEQWHPWRRYFNLPQMEAGLFSARGIKLLDSDTFLKSNDALGGSIFLWPGGSGQDKQACPAVGTFGFTSYTNTSDVGLRRNYFNRTYSGKELRVGGLWCIPTGADPSTAPALQHPNLVALIQQMLINLSSSSSTSLMLDRVELIPLRSSDELAEHALSLWGLNQHIHFSNSVEIKAQQAVDALGLCAGKGVLFSPASSTAPMPSFSLCSYLSLHWRRGDFVRLYASRSTIPAAAKALVDVMLDTHTAQLGRDLNREIVPELRKLHARGEWTRSDTQGGKQSSETGQCGAEENEQARVWELVEEPGIEETRVGRVDQGRGPVVEYAVSLSTFAATDASITEIHSLREAAATARRRVRLQRKGSEGTGSDRGQCSDLSSVVLVLGLRLVVLDDLHGELHGELHGRDGAKDPSKDLSSLTVDGLEGDSFDTTGEISDIDRRLNALQVGKSFGDHDDLIICFRLFS
jgi:hypothetical protein